MEVQYLYDGSFAGFLTCVDTALHRQEMPVSIAGEQDAPLSFYPEIKIDTDQAKARRVYAALRRSSPRGAKLIAYGFLTCLPQRELLLFQLIRRIRQEGPGFLSRPSDPDVFPIRKAVRHLMGECEKLRGFVRFSEIQGVLTGEIQPKNRVLPLLKSHFCQRLHQEQFFLYDRTHREVLLYTHGQSRILPLDEFCMAGPDAQEAAFRCLWRQFFQSVAIAERTNPRCQQTQMPLRYRSTMTEFQTDPLPLSPSTPAAAFSAPVPPDGKSAPAKRPESLPFFPASDP